MGLFYSRSMAIHFIDQANYYPETLHPLGQSSIGGVKTIRTLRSDAPFTVSDMKSSYLPHEAISRVGKGCSEPVSMDCARRQTQYGVLYTPFLGDLAEVLATACRLVGSSMDPSMQILDPEFEVRVQRRRAHSRPCRRSRPGAVHQGRSGHRATCRHSAVGHDRAPRCAVERHRWPCPRGTGAPWRV